MAQRLELRTTVTRKIRALKTLADQISLGVTQVNIKNFDLGKADDVIFALNIILGQIRDKRRILYETRKAKKQAKKLTSSLAIEIDRSYGDKKVTAKFRTSLGLKNYSQFLLLEDRLGNSIPALMIEARKLEKQAKALGLKI